MSRTFLEKVVEETRERIARVKSDHYLNAFRKRSEKVRSNSDGHRMRATLAQDGINVIAEIKRASPSKGVINANVDVASVARRYQAGGAAAISVLTEKEYFQGSIEDLLAVRRATDLPILRKDFIVDEFQIYEAAAAGADAILLIVSSLGKEYLKKLLQIAENELSMDALVEVHTKAELDIAIDAGSRIVGVNNRDLNSLDVSLDVSRFLVSDKPKGVLFVAESGLSSREEIDELRGLGFDGFLIGETLMRSDNVVDALGGLIG